MFKVKNTVPKYLIKLQVVTYFNIRFHDTHVNQYISYNLIIFDSLSGLKFISFELFRTDGV